MFKYKNERELAEMTSEQRDAYATEKRAFENDQLKKDIDKAVEDAKKQMKTANDAEKETIKADLQSKIDELADKVIDLQTNGGANGQTFEDQLKSFLKDSSDKIKELKSAGQGLIEFKAVGDITTASGTNTAPPAITGTQQAPISNVNLRDFDVTPLTTNVSTSLSAYPYTETVPKDGDFDFIAEGTVKPQTDFTWETNYAKPVKIAAWIKLTDESVQDVAGLESVANDLLRKKHAIKKSKGLLYGDGVSPNPKGATVYGRAFVAGDMALAVTNPNFMDVVNACVTDIATTHNYEDEMPYMANLVLVNPVDFYLQLVSAKDANGLPLYPTASLFNQVSIGGITIRPEETIPAGKIFVCDMSKYNTTNYMPYTVKIGWVNDDFIKNQFVILAESRFHAFVRKLDEQAFVYDDIATIKTAIATV